LPRVEIEVLPEEVKRKGLDAFERVGEQKSEVVERRRASLVRVVVVRPQFVPVERTEGFAPLVAPPPELPIAKGMAGPELLAETVVHRWQDSSPLHRQEGIYGREGLDMARSTMCSWHQVLAELVQPVVDAMSLDALFAPYLCTDATGVLVQAPGKCRRGHFWVLLAPEKHALFYYSKKHNSEAVDAMLAEYKGILLADAHAVYDHLYKTGDVVEAGCWAHTRRYFFKAMLTDRELAQVGLVLINELFRIERELQGRPPSKKKKQRELRSKGVVDRFFDWCRETRSLVVDESPIAKGLGYALNQEEALRRFLDDGRIPIHNNGSEGQLRRIAVGRKNWCFLGNDEGGEVCATFTSLLASCQMHGVEPQSYLRDLFCLVRHWPQDRMLELSPLHWTKTLAGDEARTILAANVYRTVALGADAPFCPV
jgi:transposase